MKKWIGIIAVAFVGGLVLIQLIPYGRAHANPPVVQEPQWDSAQTRELFNRACGDCHSNTTTWPAYSSVAPVSWLIYHDVQEGRQRFNVSEWNRRQEGHEAAALTAEGEMPPPYYTLMHSSAQLNPAEKQALVDGLQATFGGGTGRFERGRSNDD